MAGAGRCQPRFTHASLSLQVMRQCDVKTPPGDGIWWPVERIEDAGLPTLFAKAARLVMAQDFGAQD